MPSSASTPPSLIPLSLHDALPISNGRHKLALGPAEGRTRVAGHHTVGNPDSIKGELTLVLARAVELPRADAEALERAADPGALVFRSEERRVGKEGRCRWLQYVTK